MSTNRTSGLAVACLGLGVLAAAASPAQGGQTFNVRDYGAAGDGSAVDTAAIQAAVDACASAEGGVVQFTEGTYLSGTVVLKSNVTLQLDKAAVLLGSTDLADYPARIPAYRSHTDNYVEKSLIYAESQDNIAITGEGTIDGQGAAFYEHGKTNRPFGMRIITCSRVTVSGVTLRNSAMWMQHYLACDGVTITGVTVYNHSNRNNDMIDIDSCHDVVISDCMGDSDDDGITLKSTSLRPCEDIVVEDCTISSHCNAIKCGTDSSGGFKRLRVSNCVIRPSEDRLPIYGRAEGLAGVALEIVDGGVMGDVVVSDISIEGTTAPIFIRLGDRARKPTPDSPEPGVGTLLNVTIRRLTARDAGQVGCAITGIPDHPVEGITLEDVEISFRGGGTESDARREIEERPSAYPECTMFGTLPAYAFFIRHARTVRLADVRVDYESTEERPAIVCDDVEDIELRSSYAMVPCASEPVVRFDDVRKALLEGCDSSSEVGTFLRVEGDLSRDIRIADLLADAEHPYELGPGVAQNAVEVLAEVPGGGQTASRVAFSCAYSQPSREARSVLLAVMCAAAGFLLLRASASLMARASRPS